MQKNFYTIAARLLCVEAHDEHSAQVTENFIQGLHLLPANGGVAQNKADYILRITSEAPPEVPSGLEKFEVVNGICHTDGDTCWLELHDSLIILGSPASKTAGIWLGSTAQARNITALVNIMSYAVLGALRRCGLYSLHAAGVIAPGAGGKPGAGSLLVGDSGSGKSTLTVTLAASGWSYLSDDWILLQDSAEGVTAHGLRRCFALSAPALAVHQSPGMPDALGALVENDPSKRRLDPTIVFPHAFAPSCRPETLCFPKITGQPHSEVKSISCSQAMMQLVRQCPWATYDEPVAAGYLRTLSLLVKQTSSLSLFAGEDILQKPACLAKLLAPLLRPL